MVRVQLTALVLALASMLLAPGDAVIAQGTGSATRPPGEEPSRLVLWLLVDASPSIDEAASNPSNRVDVARAFTGLLSPGDMVNVVIFGKEPELLLEETGPRTLASPDDYQRLWSAIERLKEQRRPFTNFQELFTYLMYSLEQLDQRLATLRMKEQTHVLVVLISDGKHNIDGACESTSAASRTRCQADAEAALQRARNVRGVLVGHAAIG